MPKKSPTESTPRPRKSRAAKAAPTYEEIALRAYHLYLQRHGAAGNPFDDWKQAEQELLAEAAAEPKPRRKSKIITFAA